MNCQLCQKELEMYREGKLPEGIRVQVEAHLRSCVECAESYQLLIIADKVMNEEMSLQSNPFLSTRIMAGIEAMEQKGARAQVTPSYPKVLKPVLIGISIAIAVFIGIFEGNIYKPLHTNKALPIEMTYMNDAALESVNLFSNE